jgi:hypothetical protein
MKGREKGRTWQRKGRKIVLNRTENKVNENEGRRQKRNASKKKKKKKKKRTN